MEERFSQDRPFHGSCNRIFPSESLWIPANQLRLVVYPIIYRVLYIPGGAGILNHQQLFYDGEREQTRCDSWRGDFKIGNGRFDCNP